MDCALAADGYNPIAAEDIAAQSASPCGIRKSVKKLTDWLLLLCLFGALGYLVLAAVRDDTLHVSTAPSATPTATSTATSTLTPTPSPTATPTPTATSSTTPSATPSPTPSVTFTSMPTSTSTIASQGSESAIPLGTVQPSLTPEGTAIAAAQSPAADALTGFVIQLD
jgi:hypothetical protein